MKWLNGAVLCGFVDVRIMYIPVIAVSTNDALANAAKNIGMLLNYKNIYFVPFGQDDYVKKPNSLVADMSKICLTCQYALDGRQIQPLLL